MEKLGVINHHGLSITVVWINYNFNAEPETCNSSDSNNV